MTANPLKLLGSPNGNRTRVTGVREREHTFYNDRENHDRKAYQGFNQFQRVLGMCFFFAFLRISREKKHTGGTRHKTNKALERYLVGSPEDMRELYAEARGRVVEFNENPRI